MDNTCTDSLVTALDDEALLINDYMNDMAKSKVSGGASLRGDSPLLLFKEKEEKKVGYFGVIVTRSAPRKWPLKCVVVLPHKDAVSLLPKWLVDVWVFCTRKSTLNCY